MIDAIDNMTTQPVSMTASPVDRATRDMSKLRETAGSVVGNVFYGTLLKQMRESGIKGEYGHGGRGEEVFAAQLHNLLAERLGGCGNFELADAVARSCEEQQQRINAQDAGAAQEATR